MTDEWAERARSFGSAAASYAAGRPHYPREALEWGLPDGAHAVIDLGAGTGILTADLLELGLSVTAVEPLAEMRALIPRDAVTLDGSAEAIPMDDASCDAIFVGQAWHWFDVPNALVECRRVLRRGGRLVLLWNLVDTSDPLTRTFADVVGVEERADSLLSNDEATPPYDEPSLFDGHEQLLIPHVQGYDVNRAADFAVSRSSSIRLGDGERDAMLDGLRSAMPDEPFALNFFCEAWRAPAV
ncbi:MAG: class I SAM-dependent methyltransferase [Frankiaceae bacterium]|nr:class I SAM-dependent methyltransferase [Frankiaceae bacterium]